MTDLIERISYYLATGSYIDYRLREVLTDCKAEIQRLLTANEAMKGLCEDYQSQIKAQEYVPMTDGEVDMFLYSNFSEDRITLDDYRVIEAEVIKRAGLKVKV